MAPPESPWKRFRADAAAGRIVFKHDEAQRLAGGARRLRDVIRKIRADRSYDNHVIGWFAEAPSRSGQNLTDRFKKMAKDVDAALRGHESALSDMIHVLKTAAPKTHDSAEEWSKDGIKHLSKAPKYVPLSVQYSGGFEGTARGVTEAMKAFATKNNREIKPEDTQGLSFEQYRKIASSISWAAPLAMSQVWADVWERLQDNIPEFHNLFTTIDEDSWSGNAPEKISAAAKNYAKSLTALQLSVEVLAHSLQYTSEWLKRTYEAMRDSYVGDTYQGGGGEYAGLSGAVQSTTTYTTASWQGLDADVPERVHKNFVDQFRLILDGIYHPGLKETVSNMPSIDPAANPVVGIPDGPAAPPGGTPPTGGGLPSATAAPSGSPGLNGVNSPLASPNLGGITDATTGLTAAPVATGGLSDATSGVSGLGDATGGMGPAAAQLGQPGAPGLPTGGLPGANASLTKGGLDKKALFGGGKAGGGGLSKPLGTNIAAQAAQAAKLFPRAGLPDGALGRAGAGGPLAGSPGSPGAASPARGGQQGKGDGEHKRGDYLDSTAYLDEALGETPVAFRPVLEP